MTSWSVALLPQPPAAALFATPVLLAAFAGTALLAVAAATPQAPARVEGSPATSAAGG